MGDDEPGAYEWPEEAAPEPPRPGVVTLLVQTPGVLDYAQAGERQLCRLYLSLMAKMGVPLDTFGDATTPLAEV